MSDWWVVRYLDLPIGLSLAVRAGSDGVVRIDLVCSAFIATADDAPAKLVTSPTPWRVLVLLNPTHARELVATLDATRAALRDGLGYQASVDGESPEAGKFRFHFQSLTRRETAGGMWGECAGRRPRLALLGVHLAGPAATGWAVRGPADLDTLDEFKTALVMASKQAADRGATAVPNGPDGPGGPS